MRNNETSGCVLRGQLVFAEMRAGTLTLDCILTGDGRPSGSPVTFSARFADSGPGYLDQGLQLLFEWANDAAVIEVLVGEGRAGPRVQITSASKRVVLTSKPNGGRG